MDWRALCTQSSIKLARRRPGSPCGTLDRPVALHATHFLGESRSVPGRGWNFLPRHLEHAGCSHQRSTAADTISGESMLHRAACAASCPCTSGSARRRAGRHTRSGARPPSAFRAAASCSARSRRSDPPMWERLQPAATRTSAGAWGELSRTQKRRSEALAAELYASSSAEKLQGGMAILVVMVRGTETFQGLSNSVAAALPYRTRVH